jgi:hypothetical protein
MENIGWRFYILFCICNFTNALFFWIVLPETARRPLEEMNYLFETAPWVVIGVSKESYVQGDLERRLEEVINEKSGAVTHVDE